MKALLSLRNLLILSLAALCQLPRAYAHEVYVLNESERVRGLVAPRPDFMHTIHEHITELIFWGIVVSCILATALVISYNRNLARLLEPYLLRLKRFAPVVMRLTLGIALFASGYNRAIFGIELPVSLFKPLAVLVSSVLMVIGALLFFGIVPRLIGLVVALLFLGLGFHVGSYLLTYATYLGGAVFLVLSVETWSVYQVTAFESIWKDRIASFRQYAFLVTRILFGGSLIYSSLYAKFFHGALTLETVAKYHLTHYLPFEASFLVLGAMLTEVLLGLCFLLGIGVRFASIVFLGFLCLSMLFFGEAVWPHLILIGTAIAMFLHGYDRYTLGEMYRRSPEPVL